MKTNKSFTKRIRVTRKGKLLVSAPGKNHFNAKESRQSQLAGKRQRAVKMSNVLRSRFLAKQ